MIVLEDPCEFRALLDRERAEGKIAGLFPTTVVSHAGHTASIAKMAAECDVAAVAILSPPEPGSSYPRDVRADLERAEAGGAGVVFAPAPCALRPLAASPAAGRMRERLEGASSCSRATALAVGDLLALAGPCFAYFGEKDYEQLVLVRKVVADLCLPAAVVACPTVREPDGLALSARNSRLSASEREAAPALYWALLAGKRAVDEAGEQDAAAVRDAMAEVAGRYQLVDLEYAEVVDPETLEPVEEIWGEVRLLVSGRVGLTTLADTLAACRGEG